MLRLINYINVINNHVKSRINSGCRIDQGSDFTEYYL